MTDDRLERMQAMAKRFHANGSVDQLTMRKIDALALRAKQKEMTADKIQRLRKREHISQAVLATVLNMSSESVQKWEQGKTKPQGAALRLLNIIDEKGIAAVI
ncbi:MULTISPECIES: helix-turn-helix domain-containing protein [unclassified Vibrio]|uniref:helix-turn-helix domain-containing protein n=1 Tax=unclassified Vibrio TaxID=2614977 RepID=UPI001F2B45E6|nr:MULTISPECIES: helix-turn-helix domain-containing protein [unclassified Vibrio]MCF7456204.1 helix-turn-helix domain-containing protein [Vibrio sp. A1-1]MDW1968005.1 helix-turn-helix domain-containing protein [Vibrio sp. Vb0587]